MPTYILGISAFYHDSAACLISDGHIVAAAQEERFTRKKFDARFPTQCDPLLFAGRRHLAVRPQVLCFLRQTADQIRASSGDLRRFFAERDSILSCRDAGLAQRQDSDEKGIAG